jgi:hypothetical protein
MNKKILIKSAIKIIDLIINDQEKQPRRFIADKKTGEKYCLDIPKLPKEDLIKLQKELEKDL